MTTPLLIAFSGHADHAKIHDGAQVGEALARAFDIVRSAVGQSGAEVRLLTGVAPAADRLAIEVWRQEKQDAYVHAVFPYLDPDATAGESALTMEPPKATDQTRVALPQDFNAVTILDGTGGEAEKPTRSAHLDLARFLIGWSQALVVVWDGGLPSGPGGTGDAVRLAVAKGIPVLWVDARDGSGPYLIEPETLWADASFLELITALKGNRGPLTNETKFKAIWDAQLTKPQCDEQQAGLDEWEIICANGFARRWAERVIGDQFLWRTWAKFKSHLGRHAHTKSEMPEPTAPAPETTGSAGWQILKNALGKADAFANNVGGAHRSQQILLLVGAVLAVACGVAPAVVPALKPLFVLAELSILISGLLVWMRARDLRQHRRWSEARALAERLRASVITWPLGFDITDRTSHPAGTWPEWEARRLLRLAGPPTGVLAKARQMHDAQHGLNDLVLSQASYHHSNQHQMHAIHGSISKVENVTFSLLVACLIAFSLFAAFGPHEFDEKGEHIYHTLGGLLMMLSAIVPAIGAACIALDAKLGIEEGSARSEVLANRFTQLHQSLPDNPSLYETREVLRDAALLLVEESDTWREGFVRRKIVRGG